MYALDTACVATPIAMVVIEGDEAVVRRIRLSARGAGPVARTATIREAAARISGYFAGRSQGFDLPLAPAATPRGAVLRQAIVDVGYGETTSYGLLAGLAGPVREPRGRRARATPSPSSCRVTMCCRRAGRRDHIPPAKARVTKRWLLAFEEAVLP